MSARVKRNLPLLKMLTTSKPAATKAILTDPVLIRAICECCHNVLKGNVPLTPRQKKRLARYKKKLRQLSDRKTSIKRKRKILQTGGIAPLVAALLPAILPLASKVVSNLF